MTAIAQALEAAMDARGMTVADLARALGVKEPTLRSAVDGRVRTPQKDLRDALDSYLTPGLPPGTTLRICQGKIDSYPVEDLVELVRLVQPLPDGAVRHLIGFLRAVS